MDTSNLDFFRNNAPVEPGFAFYGCVLRLHLSDTVQRATIDKLSSSDCNSAIDERDSTECGTQLQNDFLQTFNPTAGCHHPQRRQLNHQ